MDAPGPSPVLVPPMDAPVPVGTPRAADGAPVLPVRATTRSPPAREWVSSGTVPTVVRVVPDPVAVDRDRVAIGCRAQVAALVCRAPTRP